jgi:ABC-type Zn uptake system ZnuABC Zn-binding protein ZnuA
MLDSLHRAVCEDLMAKIKSGEAKAADLAAAIKFLKDNGIEAIPVEGSPLGNLVDNLPFNVEPISKYR